MTMESRFAVTSFDKRWRRVAWVALLALALNPVLVAAQTTSATAMRLKPGDRVRLTVPGRPALDQDLVLDGSGAVTIDPVGSVHIADLTVSDAEALLKQRLRLFYTTLDTVNLEAGRAGEVQIYVLGAASAKGVLNFEAPPSLWDVLRAIGGPADNANLGEARVIRETAGAPQVFPVDLTGVMSGDAVVTFALEDGDTLVIPTLLEGVPGVNASSGVKVFGSVAVPTIVPIKEGTPLMDVLMLAGAPTESANKAKIYWVHDDGDRERATIVDLNRYLLNGDQVGNPIVYPGDTVNVEFSRPSWFQRTLPFVLGSLAAVATVALAYDRIVSQ